MNGRASVPLPGDDDFGIVGVSRFCGAGLVGAGRLGRQQRQERQESAGAEMVPLT